MKPYAISPFILQKLIWPVTRLALSAFGHMEIEGLDNIQGLKGNAIFAMNHSSEMDPFLVPASLPFLSRFAPVFYPTRERSFYDRSGWRKYLFGGLFINSWGGYNALVGFKDYSKSLVDHAAIVRDGYSFCVFPEGGITMDGNIQPGKGGVAYLAEAGDCPIVPVGISGAFRTTAADFFLGRRRLIVSYGKPIYQEQLKAYAATRVPAGGNVYKVQAEYVMARIRELVSAPQAIQAELSGRYAPSEP